MPEIEAAGGGNCRIKLLSEDFRQGVWQLCATAKSFLVQFAEKIQTGFTEPLVLVGIYRGGDYFKRFLTCSPSIGLV